MGAKSTIPISREEAIAKIIGMVESLNDKALANVLEAVNDALGDRNDWDNWLGLHNFRISKSKYSDE